MTTARNWFLAFAQSTNTPLTNKGLAWLLHTAALHAYEDGLKIPGLQLDETGWFRMNSVLIHLDGDNRNNPVTLTEDFDFSTFTQEANEFLVTIWNTYKPKEATK